MRKTACHISTTFLYKAGSCRRTYAILRAMVEDGYPTTLVVGRDYQPAPDWDMSGIEVVKVPSLVKYINAKSDIKAIWQIYHIIKKLKPVIVHTHLAKAGIVGRIAAKLAGAGAVIHTVHGPTFPETLNPLKRLLYRGLEKLCGYFTDWFVFVGVELRDEYIKAGIARQENSVVIRSGRPAADFARAAGVGQDELCSLRDSLGIAANAFVMTYVARLVPSKAQDDAIRVLKLLRDAGVDGYLVLVGEGHLKEEKNYQIVLEKQASVLGVAEFVRFTGYQPDVFRYMKAADILLMTSKYEGLPNVAVEAGICSKPLVAYRVCGLSEVIDEGRTGFVVEQGDMNKMASVIAGLARNREALEEIGNAARHKLERQYSMDRMVEEKLGFYRKIIDDVDGRTGSISAEQMILFR